MDRAPAGRLWQSAYRAVIPSGTVPAIIDGDLTLADSEAIAEYLDEHVLYPPMMPADPEACARAREISRFHDTRLEPVIRGYFAGVHATRIISRPMPVFFRTVWTSSLLSPTRPR